MRGEGHAPISLMGKLSPRSPRQPWGVGDGSAGCTFSPEGLQEGPGVAGCACPGPGSVQWERVLHGLPQPLPSPRPASPWLGDRLRPESSTARPCFPSLQALRVWAGSVREAPSWLPVCPAPWRGPSGAGQGPTLLQRLIPSLLWAPSALGQQTPAET